MEPPPLRIFLVATRSGGLPLCDFRLAPAGRGTPAQGPRRRTPAPGRHSSESRRPLAVDCDWTSSGKATRAAHFSCFSWQSLANFIGARAQPYLRTALLSVKRLGGGAAHCRLHAGVRPARLQAAHGGVRRDPARIWGKGAQATVFVGRLRRVYPVWCLPDTIPGISVFLRVFLLSRAFQ